MYAPAVALANLIASIASAVVNSWVVWTLEKAPVAEATKDPAAMVLSSEISIIATMSLSPKAKKT